MKIKYHENQWKYNEAYLNWLLSQKSTYYDWIITVIFYTSLHKMHICMHKKGFSNSQIKNHKLLNNEIASTFPTISAHYNTLYTECRRVRYYQYNLNVIPQSDLNQYIDIWNKIIKPFKP